MATNNEITKDTLWEEMKSLAVEQQQYYYELLPDCIEYKIDEHKYLRQNIGYTIYGLPMSNENANITENICSKTEVSCYWEPEDSNDTDADIVDKVNYDEKATSVINMIYNKIRECTIENDNTQSIYFGIIYNIIFCPNMNVQPKKKEVEKETKTEVKESVKEEEEEEEEEKEEKESAVSSIPIFTIRKNIQKTSDTVKSLKQKEDIKNEVQADYETWYIDICGRVYKSWADYIENNNLPKCTMVVPKDGFYQADSSYPITEDKSTVWLEVIDSPACTFSKQICDGMDIVSAIAGFGTVGLSVASMFTPLAPAVLVTGLVASGASGVWTVVRSSQQLVDRKSHEESIDILDKEALPHWLGIAGTIFGFGSLGGSAALSKAAASGQTVPTFAKVAFNTVQGGNLFLNGAGIIYQGYNMIDKYMTDKTIDKIEALHLAIHIMFFTGAVVKIQFANDIIESTQGKIINDHRDTLRKKNLRKKFNRVVRKAAENNTCKISENAEVIKYIKHREQLLSVNQLVNQPVAHGQTDKTPHNIVWSFEQDNLKVNGFILLDPVEYVVRLMKSDIFNENYKNNPSGSENYVDDSTTDQLRKVFCVLLNKFYLSDACPKSMNLPIIPDFEPLLRDMSRMKIDEESLKKLFKIVKKLMKRSRNKEDFLLMAFSFVWQYCKANLKQWEMDLRDRMQSNSDLNMLQNIIIAVFEAIDMVVNNLYSAFVEYIIANCERNKS
ncbi:uncharacterized protein LOC115237798 [Formica exsecta]|uniref:uncharacterized protein LOC115237798 n=1 Tax=Formica exsecta TaxID=72781 RepID=UPI0011420273|nr:uncharacterized protein LOC115237798 [Formica exsecta]